MGKEKNSKIQVLRGIAIIAVVMIHTCPAGKIQAYVRPFINFPVALFLFLSGYLTDVSKINTKEFCKKRIIRVLIPYTIWSFLYTTFSFTNGADVKKYFIDYITFHAMFHFYYIFVYIKLVILTPLLAKLLNKKYWYIIFLLCLLSIIGRYYLLLSGMSFNKYLSEMFRLNCLGWLLFYYMGLYLKNVIKDKKYNVKMLSIIYVLTIIIQIIEGYAWYKLVDSNCGSQMKLSVMLTNFVFLLLAYSYIKSDKFNGNNKLLVMVGNYSFGIYISHLMFRLLFITIIPFWKSIPFGVNSLILLLCSFLFAFILHKICGEKVGKYLGLY